MKIAQEFQAHVELPGRFEVFVIQTSDGTKLQVFAHGNDQKDFPAFIASRFGHLGEPAECVLHEDIRCYEIFFRGLRFPGPEEALNAMIQRTA